MKESVSSKDDEHSNATAPTTQTAASETRTFPDADPKNCPLDTRFFAVAQM